MRHMLQREGTLFSRRKVSPHGCVTQSSCLEGPVQTRARRQMGYRHVISGAECWHVSPFSARLLMC